MLELGTPAPAFRLPDVDGAMVSNSDFAGENLLVMFICNHCPYVKHVVTELSALVKQYQSKGVAVVAISSNDVENYPDDSPAKMKDFAAEHNFSFPYLYDENQDVAKAYKAACTPDFYLFDAQHKLVYRGQMDDSRPKTDIPVTGNDLTAAVNNVVAGKPISPEQVPSMGCNIKWKAGSEPAYFQLT
jgi:peroxiredoxin